MTGRGRNSAELGELFADMLRSAQTRRAHDGLKLTAESIRHDLGIDPNSWQRARSVGYLSKALFKKLNAQCDAADQAGFQRRYEGWSVKTRGLDSYKPPPSKLAQWRFKTRDAPGWEYAFAALLDTQGRSLGDIDSSTVDILQRVVHDVRTREGEAAAAENAFLFMQAAYVRFSRGALSDRRALLTAIAATIDLGALTSNPEFLKRAMSLLNDLRDKDYFAQCLHVDCRANIAEKRSLYDPSYLADAVRLYGEHVQRTRDMIAAHDIAPDYPFLHRARLGAFLNYGMMLARQGQTLSEVRDHVCRYQDAIEGINATNGNPNMDGQIFERNGDAFHAALFAELKLNRPNRSRSLKGGDPEGALAEVRCAVLRAGGVEKLPRYNAIKLLRLEHEALRCLGRPTEAADAENKLNMILGKVPS